MIDLNDPSRFGQIDPTGYLEAVETFPDQLREAFRRGVQAEGLPSSLDVVSIAVLGMGGSGISGDVCRVVLGSRLPLVVGTVKGYELPGWVGPDTLVFAASYSGETEETLASFEEALRRGSRVVIVASGGALAERGRAGGVPIIEIPRGLQPRAALGYLALPMLVVCERLGLAPGLEDEISETVELMDERAEQFGRHTPTEKNPAKSLALRLVGKLPLVYGSEGLAEVAAYRWKCQFNETSKVGSYWNVFSELDHNEVVGWGRLPEITRNFALLVLRHAGEHPRIGRRIEVTLPLIGDALAWVDQFEAKGTSPLARLCDLFYLGDFASTYLALAQGIDPAPVEVITKLKQSL